MLRTICAEYSESPDALLDGVPPSGAQPSGEAKAARDAVLPDLLAAGAAARDFARAQGGGVCVRRLWPWPAPASVARENDDINFIEAK